MSRVRGYDTTIARIAGNIASGLASKPDLKGGGAFGADGLEEWMKSIVLLSVGLARGIVEEVRRTEWPMEWPIEEIEKELRAAVPTLPADKAHRLAKRTYDIVMEATRGA